MSATYTKLFSSITDSSIWSEDHETVRVWVTMLAMADKHGHVIASLPGLANRARVSLEATERALAKFLAPDRHSQSSEKEGRRVAVIARGWSLINFAKFRTMRSTDERRAQNREAARKYREKKTKKPASSARHHSSAKSASVSQESAQAEADSEASPSPAAEAAQEREEKRAPSVLTGEPAAAPVARRKPGTSLAKPKEPAPTSATWQAYSDAYLTRYGTAPVRNATVSGQLARVLGRLGGEESPEVARWYVRSQNALYVAAGHPVSLLLRDAEKLRTEWATGRQGTGYSAHQADKNAGRLAAHRVAMLELRAEDEADEAAGRVFE